MAKKTDKPKKQNTDGVALAELAVTDEYQRYIKDHAKRMRRLEREAAGLNMVEPE